MAITHVEVYGWQFSVGQHYRGIEREQRNRQIEDRFYASNERMIILEHQLGIPRRPRTRPDEAETPLADRVLAWEDDEREKMRIEHEWSFRPRHVVD
jgi:hypothetical protein